MIQPGDGVNFGLEINKNKIMISGVIRDVNCNNTISFVNTILSKKILRKRNFQLIPEALIFFPPTAQLRKNPGAISTINPHQHKKEKSSNTYKQHFKNSWNLANHFCTSSTYDPYKHGNKVIQYLGHKSTLQSYSHYYSFFPTLHKIPLKVLHEKGHPTTWPMMPSNCVYLDILFFISVSKGFVQEHTRDSSCLSKTNHCHHSLLWALEHQQQLSRLLASEDLHAISI